MIRKTILITALLAVLLVAVSAGSNSNLRRPRSGRVMANTQLHKLEPIVRDPTQVFFTVDGDDERGFINITQRSPSFFCIPGANPPQCGKAAQDSTLLIKVRDHKFEVEALINNPSPQSFGIVSDPVVFGSWEGRNFHLKIQVYLEINRTVIVGGAPFPTNTRMFIDYTYFGEVRHGVATLKVLGLVVPYLISPTSAGLDPYQILPVFGHIDSSAEYSTLGGYRALSPYGTPASPYSPPAPYYVSGTFEDAKMEDGIYNGRISLNTVNNKVNIVDQEFISDVDLINDEKDTLLANLGWIDTGSEIYLMVAANLLSN